MKQGGFWAIRLGLAAALVVVGMALPAQAESATEEMTITPTEKHIDADPGQVITDSFTILNSGQTELDFITYASPYFVSSGDYSAIYDPGVPRADAYKWVQMDTTAWHAKVRETVRIPYTIRIPSDATPGGHYAVLFAETKPPADSSGIVRKKRLGMVLYVNVKGTAVTNGSVNKIDAAWFYTQGPLKADVVVDNKGNTDFTATTTMTVSDVFGNQKFTTSNQYNVLPGTHRDIVASWDGSPWFGIYKMHVEAVALGKTVVRDTLVVVCPLWLLGIIGVGLLIGAIDVVNRRHKKSSVRKG